MHLVVTVFQIVVFCALAAAAYAAVVLAVAVARLLLAPRGGGRC